jgi:hypothetical protein
MEREIPSSPESFGLNEQAPTRRHVKHVAAAVEFTVRMGCVKIPRPEGTEENAPLFTVPYAVRETCTGLSDPSAQGPCRKLPGLSHPMQSCSPVNGWIMAATPGPEDRDPVGMSFD